MRIKKAVILSGGAGTRLGWLGRKVPKALISLSGKTLLERHCEFLSAVGIEHVDIVFSEKYRSIVEKKMARCRLPIALSWSLFFEKHMEGPTHALIDLLRRIKTPTLFLLGDIYYHEWSLRKFAALSPCTDSAVLGVSQQSISEIEKGCHVRLNAKGLISHIQEKPTASEIKGAWAWNGWCILSPSLLVNIKKLRLSAQHRRQLLLGDLFECLRRSGVSFVGMRTPKFHININHRADVRHAKKTVKSLD